MTETAAPFDFYRDERSRTFVFPTRILQCAGVEQAERLLVPRPPLPTLEATPCATLHSGCSLLLDFGREMNGEIKITTFEVQNPSRRAQVRITLGESAAEAMSTVGENGATNDHAPRQTVADLGFMTGYTTPETGFRFARLELLTPNTELLVRTVCAVSVQREITEVGSFVCSDPLLNDIYRTAVRTVHLNMQDVLWDGIKRDRLVWLGDMHTETMTILGAYGDTSLLHKTLDFIAPVTGDGDMNNMVTYTLWWILIQYELYVYSGDLAFLSRHGRYLLHQLRRFAGAVAEDGSFSLPGWVFLDWPTQDNPVRTEAGVRGILSLTLARGAEMAEALGEVQTAALCRAAKTRLHRIRPQMDDCKNALCFLVLSGIVPPQEAHGPLTCGGAAGFSCFLGYYLLRAIAMAGDTAGALAAMRQYWGGMLSLGATSFWEDFDVEWLKNACPIDRLPQAGEVDIHAAYGRYCYTGYRHSFCHGWSSGPAPFLLRHVLGVQAAAPGMRRVTVTPHLGDLAWAEGAVPTPCGPVRVRCEKDSRGEAITQVLLPPGVERV